MRPVGNTRALPGIRPLTRKNALFAGNDVDAEHWAMLATLEATCKMSDVNPVDYIAEALRAILGGHPKGRIGDRRGA